MEVSISGYSRVPAGDNHINGAVTAQTTPAADYLPRPAVSGSWYDTTRDGEGIVLQYLPKS